MATRVKRSAITAVALAVLAGPAQGSVLLAHMATGVASPAPEPERISGFGQLVAPVGDIDGDLVGDVLISNPHQSVGGAADVGRAWIFSGRTRAVLRTLDLPDALQPGETGAFFGLGGTGLGDVNADGVADVAVSAPGLDVFVGPGSACGTPERRVPFEPNGCDENQGRVYVFSGADGALLRRIDYPSAQADPASFVSDAADFGRVLIGAGDLGGDATPDLVVTAPEENLPDPLAPDGIDHESGAAYAIDGALGTVLWRAVNPEPHPGTGARFGLGLAGPGDVNGDGADDLLLGTPFYPVFNSGQATAGRAYLLDGRTGATVLTLRHPDPVSPDSVASLFGFMSGQRGAPGDVDADGVGDLFVPAPRQVVSTVRQGRGYVFSGRTGLLLRTVDPPTPQAGGDFAFSYAPAGDLDGDGRPDLLVGQLADDQPPAVICGGAYVLGGADGALLERLEQPLRATGGGDWVGAPGDLNGDGAPDYVTGSTLADVGADANAGSALVHLSSAAALAPAGPPDGCVAAGAATSPPPPPTAPPAAPQVPPAAAARPRVPAFKGCPARSVSVIRGGAADDDLRGTPRGDRILAGGGDDDVDGRGGDDCLGLGPGHDRARGGAGDDLIVGGQGPDRLSGGAGRDRIDGGPASDRLSGGPGDDLLKARDGRRDDIVCGPGRDRVLADRLDRVAPDCEHVLRRRPRG